MANPEHVAVVKKGAQAIREWRQSNPGVSLDLSEANLNRAYLSYADLSRADLSGANLFEADLSYADFFAANFSEANLSGAYLIRADLSISMLGDVNLSRADLFGAHIYYTDFFQTNLSQANFGDTSIGDCDLSQCTGLDTVIHRTPSSIGVDTLIASFRGAGNRLTPELENFFQGAGVPEELLKALPNIVRVIVYHTCFISYGQPDIDFAEGLRGDLVASGVRCWLYTKDATPGQPSRREIGQRRREAEKMIVLCSAKGLVRDNFLNEIEDQIDEEPEKIVPVSLDNDWRHDGFLVVRGKRNLKPFLLEPNYVDFSDPAKYEESLERLLTGLVRKERQAA